MRYIMQLAPKLEMIERDLDVRPILSKTPLTLLENPLQHDADITISPCQGIICTATQKIKQKPLPGQSQRFGIRERISKIVPRYERLIVLVAGSVTADVSDTLEERDCQALLEMVTFCRTTNERISVVSIPGGDESMAMWIVGIMSTVSSESSLRLLQDETVVFSAFSW